MLVCHVLPLPAAVRVRFPFIIFACCKYSISDLTICLWCELWFDGRYLHLSSKIEKKYNDHSILLTEQINLQLRILQVSARIREETASLKEQPQPQAQQRPHLLPRASRLMLRQSGADGDTELESESLDLDDDFFAESETPSATPTRHPPERPVSACDDSTDKVNGVCLGEKRTGCRKFILVTCRCIIGDAYQLELLILKKERLQVANTVLKLALKLLKELDSPARSQSK